MSFNLMMRAAFSGVVMASAVVAGPAMAQAWSAQTVKIVVPYPPGSEPDVLARDIGQAIGKQSGKIIVVENRPGANSILGTATVASADGASGDTLLMVDRLAMVTNPYLYSKVPYQWEQTLRPVTDVARVRLFLAVRQDVPVATFGEFVAYAQKNPVNVGTGGPGHVSHIGLEMLAQAHDFKLNAIPYRGVTPAVQGLLSGDTQATMAGGMMFQPHVLSGRVKVLVVGDTQRSSTLPDVPSMPEAGVKAGSIPSTTFALFAPAKTPNAVVSQIGAAVSAALASPEVRAGYAKRGLDIATSTPAQTLASMKQDGERFAPIIRSAGMKLD